MNWTAQRLSKTKVPSEYAFSCFDNAVRFAYFLSHSTGTKHYVVGGKNCYGVHYAVAYKDEHGEERVDDSFVDGVEVRLSLKQAVSLRKKYLDEGLTRVSPSDAYGEKDKLCALAPSVSEARKWARA